MRLVCGWSLGGRFNAVEVLKIVFVIMLILVVQLVVSHVVSIDYLRLIALSLAMPKITVGFTSCSIKLLLPNTTACTKAVIVAPPDFILC